ncbi:MAG: DUF4007 family protein [Bacteroidales bacterium]|nr:DUF4007 family protein [Bacteroidales bacterium]
MDNKIRYSFSGHESFYCKSLWLKKGYDFISENKDFNAPNAVVELGIGKNMVSSLRYWMRAFGLFDEGMPTLIADYLFDNKNGKDPYIEDLGTLWLLHYLLVKSDLASIYKLFFIDFHKEKNNEFTREQLQYFLKRKNAETPYGHLYNENTVKRDIGVLLQNYVMPQKEKPNEDFSALLINLGLIKHSEDEENKIKPFYFNTKGKNELTPEIFFYAIIDDKKDEQIVSFDRLMDLALIFCLTKTELIDIIQFLSKKYSQILRYTDDGGIKQLFFLEEIDKTKVLEIYYSKQ